MLQPMIGVACAAETRGWTGWPSVCAHRVRRRGTHVPPPCHRPHAALRRVGHAVKRGGMPKGPLHTRPQPLPPLAGALRLWGILARTARRACVAPGQGMALQHARWEGGRGPGPPAPQTWGKRPWARGGRRRPPRVWPCATPAPPVGGARARMGRQAWSHPRRTGMGGPRACPAPGVAGPPAVWTVGGASGAARGRAARAHPPSAWATSAGAAAGATEAPTRPACAARPNPCALAPQGPGPRLQQRAWATSWGRPVLAGRTQAGARGKTGRPGARRLRRPRRGGGLAGAGAPQHAAPQGQASGHQAATPRGAPRAARWHRLAPCDHAPRRTRAGGSGSGGILLWSEALAWSCRPRGAQMGVMRRPEPLAIGGGVQPHVRPSTESVTTSLF